MSVNPGLFRDPMSAAKLCPVPRQPEIFLLQRPGVQFTTCLPTGKLKGKGDIFLTTERIVFVASNESSRPDFVAFEVQLRNITSHSFEQPILFSNYLDIRHEVDPSAVGGIQGCVGRTQIAFPLGNASSFVRVWLGMMSAVGGRRQQQCEEMGMVCVAGQLAQVALVDPTDPTIVYLTQPTAPVQLGAAMPVPGGTDGPLQVVSGTPVAPAPVAATVVAPTVDATAMFDAGPAGYTGCPASPSQMLAAPGLAGVAVLRPGVAYPGQPAWQQGTHGATEARTM